MSAQPLIEMGQEKIIALAHETQFAPNGIVSRTLLRAPTARVVLFGFSPGQELTVHTSTQHATIQILPANANFNSPAKRTSSKPVTFFTCRRARGMPSKQPSSSPCC